MSKKEMVVCQGVNFIIRDFDECYEGQSNGFSIHAPFIWSADEASVRGARNDIKSEIDHGANYEIIREDIGFITNKNRFVDPQEAMKIALGNDQVSEARSLWDIFKKAKNCKERNSIEEAIYRRTNILLERGLLPEDLY